MMTNPLEPTVNPALARCWHPVCYASELGVDKPLGTRLLGRHLVVWRAPDGTASAHDDLCVHRGTALSLGWLEDGCLVCPYHGWRYDDSGRCVHIPQLPRGDTAIPTKARIHAYDCIEKHGLIWVKISPEEPTYALPEVPELFGDGWILVETGPFAWTANAGRQVENFTDLGHFPWVHPGLLGDPARPLVPEHSVETKGHVLHYRVTRPEAPNSEDFPVFGNEEQTAPERVSRYELHLPYTIVLRLGWGGEKGMVYFFASQPESATSCRGYCLIARNYDLDQPDAMLQGFEDTIFGQDQRIVESQRPEQVPFDLASELHLKFDAIAIAYRRAMVAQGLD